MWQGGLRFQIDCLEHQKASFHDYSRPEHHRTLLCLHIMLEQKVNMFRDELTLLEDNLQKLNKRLDEEKTTILKDIE